MQRSGRAASTRGWYTTGIDPLATRNEAVEMLRQADAGGVEQITKNQAFSRKLRLRWYEFALPPHDRP